MNPIRIFIFSALVLWFESSALCTNYTVTSTADSGLGSLREAITNANSVFGADNIYFNIPNTDPGYNATEGVWVITLASPLPYCLYGSTNIDATTQTTNQGNTNPFGPEIVITGGGTVDHSFLLVSPGNTIKGFCISGFINGIQIGNNTATGNLITQNYIGTNAAGDTIAANGYGIAIGMSAAGNNITNNLLSGNTDGGIVISDAGTTTIKGNKIGTDRTGMFIIANSYGVVINNGSGNIVGGTSPAERNLISGNTNGGIIINTTVSTGNVVTGNFIGTDITGVARLDNGNGIMIVNSGGNTIGGNIPGKRNIISGNTEIGVILNGTGTRNNTIIGNYIGTDSTGTQILYNHGGIALKSHANSNIIGGITAADRNILSGNIEIGLYIEASDSNVIKGNYIGPDVSGITALTLGDTMFQANGMEFNTVSSHNVLGGTNANERNVISGNRVYGVIYYGQAIDNSTIGNYIGTDATGNVRMPNATGICVDGASNHNKIRNNVLSGNVSYGIFIVTTGTYYNEFTGNLLGTNAAGTDTVPNDIGLLLGGGARYNMIGGSTANDRNVFSGNHYEGIEVADIGTSYNTIKGNFFGTDITGTLAIPNRVGLGLATNPSKNTIDSNVISGNTNLGLIIFEHADSNIVTNNKIGVAVNGVSPLGNGSAGILLYNNVKHTKIGLPGKGNIIANNDSSGVVIDGTDSQYNTISCNSIYHNDFLGIEIFPPGPNANDVGDLDNGANDLLNYPVITTAGYFSGTGQTTIFGNLDTQNPQCAKVEFFKSDNDSFGYGEGKTYLGSCSVSYSGTFWCAFSGLVIGDTITCTATDSLGNTSEFSANFVVSVGNSMTDLNNDPSFILYPNPAKDEITIRSQEKGLVKIYNIENKLLLTQTIDNTIDQINLNSLANGMYFLVFTSVNYSITKKFTVNK